MSDDWFPPAAVSLPLEITDPLGGTYKVTDIDETRAVATVEGAGETWDGVSEFDYDHINRWFTPVEHETQAAPREKQDHPGSFHVDSDTRERPTTAEIRQQISDGERHPVHDADDFFTDLNVLNCTHYGADGNVTLTYLLHEVSVSDHETGDITDIPAEEIV